MHEMKTVGILGGMSAASTEIYYSELVRLTRNKLGGLHSPNLLICSLDFAPIAELQNQGDWRTQGKILNAGAKALAKGGAELLILATNTMHKVAKDMCEGVDLPFLHIADATARHIVAAGFCRPGLMATTFTMEQDFYTSRLKEQGLEPLIPKDQDRVEMHRIIYEELCKGICTEESRQTYQNIAIRLNRAGADCLILGCTEVGMLLNKTNTSLPVFDTTLIHCARCS